MKKQTTCCFTGPRPHKLPLLASPSSLRRDMLRQEIAAAVIGKIANDGCNTFLCGMAQGSDMLFAEIILELKHIYGDCAKLVCAIPYEAQAARWPAGAREQYCGLLSQADERIVLQKEYTDGCLLARNRFMTENSAHMIAVYDGRPGGGTGYTVNYAREQNLRITIINPKNF